MNSKLPVPPAHLRLPTVLDKTHYTDEQYADYARDQIEGADVLLKSGYPLSSGAHRKQGQMALELKRIPRPEDYRKIVQDDLRRRGKQ